MVAQLRCVEDLPAADVEPGHTWRPAWPPQPTGLLPSGRPWVQPFASTPSASETPSNCSDGRTHAVVAGGIHGRQRRVGMIGSAAARCGRGARTRRSGTGAGAGGEVGVAVGAGVVVRTGRAWVRGRLRRRDWGRRRRLRPRSRHPRRVRARPSRSQQNAEVDASDCPSNQCCRRPERVILSMLVSLRATRRSPTLIRHGGSGHLSPVAECRIWLARDQRRAVDDDL